MPDVKAENKVTLKLKDGQQIKFTNVNTGTESVRVISGDAITVSRGSVYVLPINESDLDLADHHIIKESQILASKLIVRDVSNGTITIYPIVNGVSLTNDLFMGVLI